MKTKKIIIAGGRDYNNYGELASFCNSVIPEGNHTIISGGPKGADQLGEQYALQKGYVPADWQKYGRSAGPVRNKQMAKNAEMLIAFWNGKSKGTANMIKQASAKGLIVEVFTTT